MLLKLSEIASQVKEEASEKSCNSRVIVFCNPCRMSFHFIWPSSNILRTQSLKEKTTKTERKIWNYNLITSSQQTTHNAAAPYRILFWRSFHSVFSSTFLLIIFSCRLSQQILCLWPRRYAYANIRARYSFLSLLWRNPFSYEHAHTHTETCPDKKDYAPCLDKCAKGKHLVRSSEFAWQLRVDRFPLLPLPRFSWWISFIFVEKSSTQFWQLRNEAHNADTTAGFAECRISRCVLIEEEGVTER